MEPNLQQRIEAALRNPQNMGELENADAIGTVGNASCGEMLRMWIKFKEERGRKIIDRATFQSFGCETAIAVASLATELIRGKTSEEALALSGQELAAELGPLPPMKIHCAQLVEGALQAALKPQTAPPACEGAPALDPNPDSASAGAPATPPAPSLLDQFTQPKPGGVKVVFLPPDSGGGNSP